MSILDSGNSFFFVLPQTSHLSEPLSVPAIKLKAKSMFLLLGHNVSGTGHIWPLFKRDPRNGLSSLLVCSRTTLECHLNFTKGYYCGNTHQAVHLLGFLNFIKINDLHSNPF